MTAEVYLTEEQEAQLSLVREKKGEGYSEQELIQDLFNEALRANYITYRSVDGSPADRNERLVCIDFEADDYPTDEEIREILSEIYEEEGALLS